MTDPAGLGTVTGAGSVEPARPVRTAGRGARGWRWAVLVVLGLYFVVPIAASVWFTIRDRGQGGLTARYYTGIPGAAGAAPPARRSAP